MAKAAIPRFLIPLLILGALAATVYFLVNQGGASFFAPVTETDRPEEPPTPPAPKRPDRPDVDLWEKWNGKPISEILAAMAPALPSVDPNSLATLATLATLDGALAVEADADPYLPRFIPVSGVSMPPADDAVPLGDFVVLSSHGLPLSAWKISADDAEAVTSGTGLTSILGGSRLLPADFDRDGHVDLFVGRAGGLPDSLLKGAADGSYEDITETAGLLEFLDFADAAWVDVDRDGWLDLCVVQHPPVGSKDSIIRLYLNQSGKTFTDSAKAAGLEIQGRVKQILWRDFDDDGYPDLVVSLQGEPGSLRWFRSVAGDSGETRRFEDGTTASGLSGIAGGGPLAAGDLDGDGLDDLVAASGGKLTLLTASPGESPLFTEQSTLARLSGIASPTALALGDIDRDGIPDLALSGAPPAAPEVRAWWNLGGLQMREIPGAAGLVAPVSLRRFVDLGSGDAGSPGWLLLAGGKWRSSLRQAASPLIAERSRLEIRLEAPESANRDGLGARVAVTTRDRSWIYRTLTVTVDQVPQTIGLDEAVAVESLDLVWPDRSRTSYRFENLPVNQRLEIGPGPEDIRQTPLP